MREYNLSAYKNNYSDYQFILKEINVSQIHLICKCKYIFLLLFPSFISGPGPGGGSGNQQYRGGPQTYQQQGPQQGYPGQYPGQNQVSAQVLHQLT
jgi:hypothetical protein